MTELQRQFMEETGVSFDGIPINGVHLEYITWLEAQIQALRQPLVSGRSEQSNCVHCYEHILTVKTLKYNCKNCGDEKWEQLDCH